MSSESSHLSERVIAETLRQIQALQTIESQLYTQLSDPGTSQPKKQEILARIQSLAQLRATLYANIGNMHDYLAQTVGDRQITLSEQWNAIDIVDRVLSENKEKLGRLTEETNNKLRQTEINTYFMKEYTAKIGILKMVVLCVVAIMVVYGLSGVLPSWLSTILVALIVVVGLFVVVTRVIDVSNRDSMNYDEYDYWTSGRSMREAVDTNNTAPITIGAPVGGGQCGR